jgi:hypothetical protein
MATLDSLPADQRAVLQLVLQRGRSYDEIAAMLSIDRAGVRQRALTALDELGPQTGVEAGRRAIITDYLLGQLPEHVSADTRERLGDSPRERAWARVVASELSPLAAKPLPEIPTESVHAEAPEPNVAAEYSEEAEQEQRSVAAVAASPATAAVAEREPDRPGPTASSRPPRAGGPRRSSRRGGAILIGFAVLVVIVAVVIIATGGSSSKHTSSTTIASTSTATTASTTASTSTSSTTPQVIRQINLAAPETASKTKGLADVLRQGTTDGIAIIAQNVPPNTTHDAYAVWLYNSPTDSVKLGFVNPGVGSNGRLSAAAPLPPTAGHYKQLIITLETQSNPKVPGKVILQGPLSLS